jgi:type-F conjugative transfer system pilin assembly protein TrbC
MKMSNTLTISVLAASLALFSSTSHAQDTNAKDTPNRAMTLESLSKGVTAEKRKEIEEMARAITQNAQGARDSEFGKQIAATGAQMQRRVDQIADEAMSADRERVLKFLGIDEKADASLYFFVSFEMPLEVLRAYAVEAMWTGGTLVVKGVPPGRDLGKFITEDLRSLVYGKGASSVISLDPRLFDGYQVTSVPAIVYTLERSNFDCRTSKPTVFEYQEQKLSYDQCPPVDPSKYWKISGAVTADFALREFIKAGASGAQANLDALAKGFATGTVAPKSQQPFTGNWKEAFTPEELMAIKEAAETAKSTGMGTSPPAKSPTP